MVFWVETNAFGVRTGLRKQKTKFYSIRQIFGTAVWPVIFAITLAIVLQFFDSHAKLLYARFGVSVPNDADYIAFLATVAGIGSVFIGLYYAGVSAIGSAIYATVPNNIRDLLAEERYGNTYMRFLAFLTVLSLIFIAFRLIGLAYNHSAIPIVALCSAVGVIAFVQLGRRAFYLFDPTKLSFHIFERLNHWLRTVRVGGFQWSNRSFQEHAHRNASATLETLQTLTDITAEARHLRGKPFIELSQQLVQFLTQYEQSKAGIPFDSLWYEQQFQQRDWFRTEYSQVSVAHETGTLLQPTTVTNKEWVEARVLPIVMRCVKVNLGDKKYSDVHGLFALVNIYIGILGRAGEVQRALETISTLGVVVLDQVVVPGDSRPGTNDTLEKIAIIESLASLLVSLAIAYREHIASIGKRQIHKKVASINWRSNRSIYSHGIPGYCLPQLEWLRPRLVFEFNIEGKYVTPRWYQSELVVRSAAGRFTENCNALVDKGIALFEKMITTVLNQEHPWLAAALMSREWEYWHKLHDQFKVWEKSWSDLASDRRIRGLRWSEFDADRIEARINRRKSNLVSSMSHHSVKLDLSTRPAKFPDYAGQFLHISGEVVLDSLVNNDSDLLENVFEFYLVGCINKFQNLLPKGGNIDWQERQAIKIAAAPLLDAMDVSGYTRLLADFHENDKLWNTVYTIWSQCLTSKESRLSVPMLVAALNITDAAFEIPHRGIHRTTWNQKISEKLMDVPRHEEYHEDSIVSYTVIDHKSSLVRAYAKSDLGCLYDGIDAFIEFYLNKFKSASCLEFGSKRRSLRDSIALEEKRIRKTNDGGFI